MEEQDVLAETIGKNIMRLRKMANMTQLDLAEKLNYSDKSISKWEQGNGIPDVRILVRLAELFNVSVDDLVREHKEKEVLPRNTKLLRRIIILMLSVGLCWLIAVVGFVLFHIFLDMPYVWLAFLFAVPASAIVVLVFSCIWGWKWARVVSLSVLIWTALAVVCVTSYLYGHAIWLVFLIGVPLQVLALFFFVWWKRAHSFRLFRRK